MPQQDESRIAPRMLARRDRDARRHHFGARDGADRGSMIHEEMRAAMERGAVGEREVPAHAPLGGVVERDERLGGRPRRAVHLEGQRRAAAGGRRWRRLGIFVCLRLGSRVEEMDDVGAVLDRLVGDDEIAADLVVLHVAEEPLPGLVRVRLEKPRGAHPVLRERAGVPLDQRPVPLPQQVVVGAGRIVDAQPQLAFQLLEAGDADDVPAVLAGGQAAVEHHRVVAPDRVQQRSEALLHAGPVGLDLFLRAPLQVPLGVLPPGHFEDLRRRAAAGRGDSRDRVRVRSAQEAQVLSQLAVRARAGVARLVSHVLGGLALRLAVLGVDHRGCRAAAPHPALDLAVVLGETGNVEPASLGPELICLRHPIRRPDRIVRLQGQRGLHRAPPRETQHAAFVTWRPPRITT